MQQVLRILFRAEQEEAEEQSITEEREDEGDQ